MSFISFITLICMLCINQRSAFTAHDAPDKSPSEIYIVHVEGPTEQFTTLSEDLDSWYGSFLPTITTSSNERESRIVYSYRKVFKGFAANLSPEEVKEMEKKEGFVSARPEIKLPLHTTYSPGFLGLNRETGFWKDSYYGRSVIIGILDTGIFPEHPSFSDEGMPPPPAKWKGRCEFNHTACNNKIIGARSFGSTAGGGGGGGGQITPLDDDGHGTHTARTVAGNFVNVGCNTYTQVHVSYK